MALIQFEDLPSTNTPITANNLNKIQEGNIYSTDEIEIGKWIDNKPIYRKVLNIPSPTFNSYVNHNISNIDNIVDIKYMIKEGGNSFKTLPIVYQESGNLLPRFCISPYIFNDTQYLISAGSYFDDYASNMTLKIIAEYTKTTD